MFIVKLKDARGVVGGIFQLKDATELSDFKKSFEAGGIHEVKNKVHDLIDGDQNQTVGYNLKAFGSYEVIE